MSKLRQKQPKKKSQERKNISGLELVLKNPKENDAKKNRKHVGSKTKAGKKTRTNICHQTMGKLYSTPSKTMKFEKNKTASK